MNQQLLQQRLKDPFTGVEVDSLPEPYKGKGVRYADEQVRRKEAKKK